MKELLKELIQIREELEKITERLGIKIEEKIGVKPEEVKRVSSKEE